MEEQRLWMCENRVLRRIFGSKTDEITGGWRRLNEEELSDLYCSPNVFLVIKPRRMRWVGHVACMKERKVTYRFLAGKPQGERLFAELVVDMRIILK
jgi:hypothetical protein